MPSGRILEFSAASKKHKQSVINSIDPNYRPYTMASSCGIGESETSTADLRRTSIKFSSTILPYYIRGHIPQGGAELSSNNQVLTVKSIGNCADTYFVYFEDGYDNFLFYLFHHLIDKCATISPRCTSW